MRPATGWFSYSLRNPKAKARTLRVTYFGGDKGRPFFILVNDQLPHKVTSNTNQRNELFDVDYPLPETLRTGAVSQTLTVQFVAEPGSTAGRVFDARLLK
jgi:hypothetical protein